MNSTPHNGAASGDDDHALVAERWLLASDDANRLFALPTALARAADQSPLLAWRLRNGLVQRLPLKALPEKLAEALASGASGVNLWADMEADALDSLVWRQVPVARQPQVAWQPWPAAAGGATAAAGDNSDGVADADGDLLQALARPDAWAEVAWRLNGCEQPPPLVVRPGADAQAQRADHAAAFSQWVDAQWQGLDAAAVADAKARDDVRVEPDLPLADQPMPEAVRSINGPVLEPALPVRVGARIGRVMGLRAAAAAGGASVSWTVLHTWEGVALKHRHGHAAAPTYLVTLQGDGAPDGPHAKLRVRVLLQKEVWLRRKGLQLWFVPEDDLPMQLKLREAWPEDGWLTSNTELPIEPADAMAPHPMAPHALADWLRACRLVLSAEAGGV